MLHYLKRNETLVILCVEAMLMMMGVGLISPTLPLYAQTFGVSITMIGLLITVFGVARIMADIPAGHLSEKLGRRPILVAGPLILAIGSVACGLADSYWELLAFRFIQGIGSAMFTTASMITLADISTPDNRGQVMSIYWGSILLGAGMGPVVGGFTAQYLGLQAPFFAIAFFAILAALWAYLRLPETRPAGQVTSGLPTNPELPSANSRTGLKPLLWNLNFILLCTVAFSVFFMRTGAQNQILPLLGSDRIGLSEGQIGVALTLVVIMQFATIFLSGRLSDRFGRKVVITPGCLIAAASLVMLAQSYSYWFLLLSCVVMGIGLGISGPTTSAYVADIIPKENYSSGIGLYRTIVDLGFVIGPILLGWLADMRGFSFSLLFNSLLLFLVVFLFQVWAKEPSRRRGEDTSNLLSNP
ncbi:MAG TPA: MFS transporter [Dehalococcoidia bacterium]|nr:MFS transporter [Dehalococcoidia bacterium]